MLTCVLDTRCLQFLFFSSFFQMFLGRKTVKNFLLLFFSAAGMQDSGLENPSLFCFCRKKWVCTKRRLFLCHDFSPCFSFYSSGLKNDPTPETFRLRHMINGHYLPIRYVKILPLLSWGPSFNYSIWFVSLNGDDRDTVVKPALAWHNEVGKTLWPVKTMLT